MRSVYTKRYSEKVLVGNYFWRLVYTPLEKVGDDVKGIPPIPKDGKESKVEKKPSKKKGKKEEESLF